MKLNKEALNLELRGNYSDFIISGEKFSITKTKISDDDINPLENVFNSYNIDNSSFVLLNKSQSFRDELLLNYYYGIHFFDYIVDSVEMPVYLVWEPNNKAVFYKSFSDETGELAIKIAEYDYVILNSAQIQLNRVGGSLPESLLLTANHYKT